MIRDINHDIKGCKIRYRETLLPTAIIIMSGCDCRAFYPVPMLSLAILSSLSPYNPCLIDHALRDVIIGYISSPLVFGVSFIN